MKFSRIIHLFQVLLIVVTMGGNVLAQNPVLSYDSVKSYIDDFNENDEEHYTQEIPNEAAWEFLKNNIPLFECPDKQLERTYYFRWWTYRKHLKRTPEGYIITEFLPEVPWSGKYNAIDCPAGHHFYEGRWLHTPVYLKDYARFWYRGEAGLRTYSSWLTHAVLDFTKVHPDTSLLLDLLPAFVADFEAWESIRFDSTGMFWQIDGYDGMEVSVSGLLSKNHDGYRATINSYMYGNAVAIREIAQIAGDQKLMKIYQTKADFIRKQILERLWDENANFFKVIPRGLPELKFSNVRELHGYTPWYFSIPETTHTRAWEQLFDEQGFNAPYGPTTTEQRHAGFKLSYEGHECQWNGPSWPFATSITLKGLANLLHDYEQNTVTPRQFLELLTTYSRSHQRIREDGKIVSWIDENLNPYTGDWISRTRLKSWTPTGWSPQKGGVERGKDYNHSSFNDHVISGLIGIRPQMGNQLVVHPLVPEGYWDYFCLDKVSYHGRIITVLYDRTGQKYGKGKGLQVWVNGVQVAGSEQIKRLAVTL